MGQHSAGTSLERIACLVFDVGGTLVDNLDLIVDSLNWAVAEHAGKRFTNEEAYARFGPTLEQMIAEFVPSDKLWEAIEDYHDHYEKCFSTMARPYPGIRELLETMIESEVKTPICTGSSKRITQARLECSGLKHLFSTIVSADDVVQQKPDPQGVILAMRLAEADPVHTVFLGDSVRDIEASRRAGIRSAAALWGFGDENQLRSAAPDYTFKEPSEAFRLLA